MKHYLILNLLVVLLFAQTIQGQPVAMDSANVEAFIDGTIKSYMNDNHIAGATVAIIKDGTPLVIKGYGYADLEQQQVVDPNRTLFRIGSISKLFVWTAVMQLVERGQLDLNANINQYLEDFKIPDTYPEPITLKHLMTHTAGFEEYVLGLFARDSTRVQPLEHILNEEMPARVRPPGIYASYSNHGTAIAAYIIEKQSGLPFQEYVRNNILSPLGMQATTFQQPLPDSLDQRMSRGYEYSNGAFVEKSFEYVPLAPVGAATTTATGMIPFMQAHLNLGQFQGRAILDSTTATLMQSPAFSHAEEVNPMLYGFIDLSQNGVKIFGHGGDTLWFHSLIALFPDYDLGFFISFNSAAGGPVTAKILEEFVDQYFPLDTTASETLTLDEAYLQRFAGNYRPNRYPRNRLTKIMALFNPITVSVTDGGKLRTVQNDEGNTWVPTDSLTFQKERGSKHLVFDVNSSNQVTHLYLDDLPIIAFEKTPFIASQSLHQTIITIGFTAFLITILYWPLAYFIRRNYRSSLLAKPPLPIYIKITAWLHSLLMLIFYIRMANAVSGPEQIVYGLDPTAKFLLIIPIISMVITIFLGYMSLQYWKKSTSGFWSRFSLSLLSLVSFLCLWQLYFWNLLGFQY